MTIAPPSLRDIMADAQWLAHRYDPGHDAFQLRYVPRSRHAQVPFLTDDHLGERDPLVVQTGEAIENAPPSGPIHFLFHSAFCCSTLLAAAFNVPGVAMGLKEPVVLNDIVGWRHRGAAGPQVARVLDQSLRLLARPFAPGESIIVKPSNLINPLIPAIMTMRSQARALLLHAPLDAYLASIARKGMWGRLWVRDAFAKLAREGMMAPTGVSPDDFLGLTDIQVAAVGWLAQQHQFARLVHQFGDRVATLDSDTLMHRPFDAMTALARLYDVRLEAEIIAAIVDGPVFARDSKTGAAFDQGQRARDAQRGIDLHREEVEKVGAWARVLADKAGIPLRLAAPLIP